VFQGGIGAGIEFQRGHQRDWSAAQAT